MSNRIIAIKRKQAEKSRFMVTLLAIWGTLVFVGAIIGVIIAGPLLLKLNPLLCLIGAVIVGGMASFPYFALSVALDDLYAIRCFAEGYTVSKGDEGKDEE